MATTHSKAIVTSFRLEKKLLMLLQQEAKKQNRTVSNLLNVLIIKYLNNVK